MDKETEKSTASLIDEKYTSLLWAPTEDGCGVNSKRCCSCGVKSKRCCSDGKLKENRTSVGVMDDGGRALGGLDGLD